MYIFFIPKRINKSLDMAVGETGKTWTFFFYFNGGLNELIVPIQIKKPVSSEKKKLEQKKMASDSS